MSGRGLTVSLQSLQSPNPEPRIYTVHLLRKELLRNQAERQNLENAAERNGAALVEARLRFTVSGVRA